MRLFQLNHPAFLALLQRRAKEIAIPSIVKSEDGRRLGVIER